MEVRRYERTKACPYCAEEILIAAIKCKHCGSNLTHPPPAAATNAQPTWKRPVGKGDLMGSGFAIFLLIMWGLYSAGVFDRKKSGDSAPSPVSTAGPLASSVNTRDPAPAEVEEIHQNHKASVARPKTSPPENSEPAELPALTTQISGNNLVLNIKNNDTFAWKNCDAAINERFFHSGYLLDFGNVDAGQSVTLDTTQFAHPDGERFNPFNAKILTIAFDCTTPKGRQYWGGKFN